MTARWITSAETESSHRFLEAHGDGFSSPNRLSIYGDALKLLGVFDKGDSLQGVMMLYAARIRGRASLSTPPFSPWTGPYLHLRSEHPANRKSEVKTHLEAIAHFLKEEKKPLVNVAIHPRIHDMQPFMWAGFEASPKYSYRLNLSLSEGELFSAIASKRRSVIRGGEHLLFQESSDLSQVATWARTHLKHLKAFHEPEVFYALFNSNEAESLRAFEVHLDQKPISWLVFLQDGDTVYYLLGGPAEEKPHPAAASWALWQSILQFKEEGLKVFDFEGSMIPEVEHVFRSFGGDMITYFTLHLKDRLNKVVDMIR